MKLCRNLSSLLWMLSPSMRREWIEIYSLRDINNENSVSLHAEGVD